MSRNCECGVALPRGHSLWKIPLQRAQFMNVTSTKGIVLAGFGLNAVADNPQQLWVCKAACFLLHVPGPCLLRAHALVVPVPHRRLCLA
eukprot:1147905-Pelagomonas_calceolata.AAC.4